ncbi:sugar phosphate isomerase/epimerase family protein [Nocardia carnea]|uniref:sugar phosphate isomerase/epimerase family protein n=1 Tax=Nocardia carnea TaxID=37328 RepID=UPI002457AE44|nr:sugar phosphate isomerase/epimerase family protein [Nocardia carnea]
MNPRISVSGLCFRPLPLPELIEELQRLQVGTTTLLARDLQEFGVDRARELLETSGISVAGLIGDFPPNLADPDTWESSRSALIDALDIAVLLGTPLVYTVTGPLIDGDVRTSVDTFGRFIAPVIAHADEVGVKFLLESTIRDYAYVSFVHSLDTALDLARRCNTGICADLFHVWNDPDLMRVLHESIELVPLVQIGDCAVDSDGNVQKEIPGLGTVPLADLIGKIVDAGYQGVFDLEIDGPLIDAVGSSTAAERAVAFLDKTLSALPAAGDHGRLHQR